MTADENIAEILKRVESDISGNGKTCTYPLLMNRLHLSTVGEENAKRLRAAGENTARMVEEQAAERLAVAESVVEEAKALQDKAKQIANDIRAAAEKDAKRSIELTTWMDETGSMMEQVRQKFDAQEQ